MFKERQWLANTTKISKKAKTTYRPSDSFLNAIFTAYDIFKCHYVQDTVLSTTQRRNHQ